MTSLYRMSLVRSRDHGIAWSSQNQGLKTKENLKFLANLASLITQAPKGNLQRKKRIKVTKNHRR